MYRVTQLFCAAQVFLRASCQVVRPVPVAAVPRDGVADHVATGNCVAFLEVVDLMAQEVRYVPVPEPAQQSAYGAWYKQTNPDKVLVSIYRFFVIDS